MKERESHARTQRVLGMWGLVALGTTANFAVIGVIIITLAPTEANQTSDALTALSSVAAAGIGALAGWLSRGQTIGDVPDPPLSYKKEIDSPDQDATLTVEARPDSTIRP